MKPPELNFTRAAKLPLPFPRPCAVAPSSRLTLAERKTKFLNQLLSPSGKNKYKRYLGSPLRYAGGKSLAVGYVIEHLPDRLERLVSPFFGGGSVEIAVAQELGVPVLGFEIFDILVNFWQVLLHRPEELYRGLAALKPTAAEYARVKAKLKEHWQGRLTLEPLLLAAYYYFNHNLSYGPGFLGWMSSVYKDENKYRAMIEKVRNFRAPNLAVECASFEQVIQKHRDDFLYCDPPYYLGPDSTLFRGIYPQRNFPVHHNNFDHQKLRQLLVEHHRNGFILSYNDCPTIRKWYADCKIIEVAWQYTMGQGETRIGVNRRKEERGYIKNSREILLVKCG